MIGVGAKDLRSRLDISKASYRQSMPSRDSVHLRATDAEDVKDGVRTYRLSYEA